MKRKTVAVFAANIYQDMVKSTQYGIIREAKRNNTKLIFFTSFSDHFSTKQYAKFSAYDEGNFSVFMLPDLSRYDGLVSLDTYLPDFFVEPINKLKEKAKCPVVTLGDTRDFSFNVVDDQDASMAKIIEHLIDEHGCRELVHVSGNQDYTFCQDRIRIFKETLKKRGIPFTDEHIIEGNLWYDCGDYVVSTLLKMYERDANRVLPDAIVCANDYSAIGIMNSLSQRGYSVPEDVIVTGYDDVIQSRYSDPSLTTATQRFEEVGATGIKILSGFWKDGKAKKINAVEGEVKCRQSCGCMPKHTYIHDDLKDSYRSTIDRLGDLAQANTNTILSVATAESIVDVFDEIESNCRRSTGFKDAVLCLMKDWDKQIVVSSHEDLQDKEFEVVCGIYNDRPVKRGMLEKGMLLPTEMMEDNEAYYVVPIHFLQHFMGYFIVSPDLENTQQINMKSWFLNISTLLENWRIKSELKKNLETLRNLYMTDMLTGLYNRRGYENNFEAYYKECEQSGTGLAVYLIDMDNLKIMNDYFGHEEGDYCLCAIAKAMRKAAEDDEICIRSGGDEFVVLGKNYTEEKADKFKLRLRDTLAKMCDKDKKDYEISVSIGCFIDIPRKHQEKSMIDIGEYYLKEADKLMYSEKKQHKAGMVR